MSRSASIALRAERSSPKRQKKDTTFSSWASRTRAARAEGSIRMSATSPQSLAVVSANGDHLKQPQQSPLHLLVPVTGNEVSRRAADVAIAIARASDCPITALYVATGGAGNGRKRRGFRARR